MRRTLIRLALLLLSLSVGCTRADGPGSDEIVWRLVDWPSVEASPAPPFSAIPQGTELGPAPFTIRGPSRAMINDDQRYTFRRPELEFVYRDPAFQVPTAETFTLDVGLPEMLRGCDVLTTEVVLTSIDASIVRRVIGTCTGTRDDQHLHVTIASPPVLQETAVDLWVHARRPLSQGIRQRRFTIPKVPPHARLTFSYGVESPGWEPEASAVMFHVLVDGNWTPLFFARLDPALNPSQRRWFDASIDLGAYAGQPLPLVFQTALDRAEDRHPFGRPIWGNPTIVARRQNDAPAPRPNVLLVSLDTLRARSVGAYGRERPTTPFLDSLGRDGVVFTQAAAQSTTTPQSHMTLFTSLYPSKHGITDLTRGSDLDAYRMLSEILRERGWQTGAVTEDGLLQASLGFERGFDTYTENKGVDVAAAIGQIETTFQRATDWLAKHREAPFFLFIHTYQVHDPYMPPDGYRGMFGATDADGPDAELDRYEEEVRYVDDQLARLWKSLEALGLADDTMLIVTSDHGEEFGEHGLLRHGSHLYDETLLVPLVMHAPFLPRGARIDAQVGLIDVMPTVLDLLGVPMPDGVQGRSLAALLRDDGPARARLVRELNERELFAEAWGLIRVRTDGSVDEDWRPPIYASRTAALKVVYDPQMSDAQSNAITAFDLTSDPLERDRSGTVVDGARASLLGYAHTASPPQAAGAALPQPDIATTDKLRALGYIR